LLDCIHGSLQQEFRGKGQYKKDNKADQPVQFQKRILQRCGGKEQFWCVLKRLLERVGDDVRRFIHVPQPVRFVNSLGLGKEPSIEPVRRRLARSPGVRFKLDAEATWAPALVDEVGATGAVDTIDFKGQYGFEVEDPEALSALYDHVLAAFPDAYLEDPHDLPEIAQRLGDHLERVSYDSPIRSAEDIGATPLAARVVNVKPSRIGSLRALFEVYARCARERRPMYGGGMGELGVGRGQIERLAALFHADAPYDVAPSAYNEDDPPGGLPASPLAPRPEATGFRWAA